MECNVGLKTPEKKYDSISKDKEDFFIQYLNINETPNKKEEPNIFNINMETLRELFKNYKANQAIDTKPKGSVDNVKLNVDKGNFLTKQIYLDEEVAFKEEYMKSTSDLKAPKKKYDSISNERRDLIIQYLNKQEKPNMKEVSDTFNINIKSLYRLYKNYKDNKDIHKRPKKCARNGKVDIDESNLIITKQIDMSYTNDKDYKDINKKPKESITNGKLDVDDSNFLMKQIYVDNNVSFGSEEIESTPSLKSFKKRYDSISNERRDLIIQYLNTQEKPNMKEVSDIFNINIKSLYRLHKNYKDNKDIYRKSKGCINNVELDIDDSHLITKDIDLGYIVEVRDEDIECITMEPI